MKNSSVSKFLSQFPSDEIFAPEDSNITIAEWDAPGTLPNEEPIAIAPLHRHFYDDEAWYVLEGTLKFKADKEIIEAKSGDAVIIPKGTPHTFWNPSLQPAKYLLIMTARIKDLVNEIHSSAPHNYEEMKKLFEKYESELLE